MLHYLATNREEEVGIVYVIFRGALLINYEDSKGERRMSTNYSIKLEKYEISARLKVRIGGWNKRANKFSFDDG